MEAKQGSAGQSSVPTKQTVVMWTNITPKDMRRRFLIYPQVPLHKYIELYEQVFEIDLYAYRVTFQYEKQGINKLEDLKDEGILGDKDIEIELIVESVGG